MSLSLDAIFLDAIETDETIMEMIGQHEETDDEGQTVLVGGRRWCTSAPMPEEQFLDNVEVPYIIVNFDGFSTEDGTKDDDYDSGEDTVQISITVAAKNNEQLGELAGRVRRAVHSYMTVHMGESGIPYSTKPGGGRKFYDEEKPCYGINLTWECKTSFDLNDEDDEQDEG